MPVKPERIEKLKRGDLIRFRVSEHAPIRIGMFMGKSGKNMISAFPIDKNEESACNFVVNVRNVKSIIPLPESHQTKKIKVANVFVLTENLVDAYLKFRKAKKK